MTAPAPTDKDRLIAIALLLDQGETAATGATPDLAELDQWRRGLLAPNRAGEVLAHLVRDPVLLDQLRQLEAAGPILAHWERESGHSCAATGKPASSEAVKKSPSPRSRGEGWGEGYEKSKPYTLTLPSPSRGRGIIHNLSRLSEWLGRLTRLAWAGGLATVAAALVLTMVIPGLRTPDLDRQLDLLYAESTDTAPYPVSQWPWRVTVQTKSLDFWPGPGKRQGSLERQAFQAGVRHGLARLGASGAPWQPTLSVLPSEVPACPAGDAACPARLNLAQQTGYWAVAQLRQCQSPRNDGEKLALAGESLRQRWAELGDGQELSTQMRGIGGGADRCQAATQLLDWGLH